jgi:hypothetical protein
MRVKGYVWVVTYDLLIANRSIKILTKDGYEAHVNRCLFSSLWKGQIIYTNKHRIVNAKFGQDKIQNEFLHL